MNYEALSDDELNARISELTGVAADYAHDCAAMLKLWFGIVGFSLQAGARLWRIIWETEPDGQIWTWNIDPARGMAEVWIEYQDYLKTRGKR